MRFVAVAVLTLVAALAGPAPALAQSDPICADKARQWEILRLSSDVEALARFGSTIPSSCTDLKREVNLALSRMRGPPASAAAPAAGARSSGLSGYDLASPGADNPLAAPAVDVFEETSVATSSAREEEARAEEQNRMRREAERRAEQQLHAQAETEAANAGASKAGVGKEAGAGMGAGAGRAGAGRADEGKAAHSTAKTGRPSPTPSQTAGPTVASIPPAVALPVGYQIVSHVLTPTESYLPKRDGMPTGVVLLDIREKTKNQSLCKALLGAHTATVKTEAAARRDNPRGDFLVTHWPVTSTLAKEDDCIELLAKYDFERASRVKNAYALSGSRGPVFLALDPTGEIVFLDLKDASADAVFKATSDWMKLALASPQNRPAAQARLGLVAGTSRLFGELASGFASLVGSDAGAPTVVKFNDPVKGTSRQFNIYKAGVFLIGATFAL